MTGRWGRRAFASHLAVAWFQAELRTGTCVLGGGGTWGGEGWGFWGNIENGSQDGDFFAKQSLFYCKILSYVLAALGCYNVFFVLLNDDSHGGVLSIDFHVLAWPRVGRQITVLDISRSREPGSGTLW